MSANSNANIEHTFRFMASVCAGGTPQNLSVDWSALPRLAAQHRVIPLFYKNVRALRIGLATQVADALHCHVQSNAARTLALAGQLRTLLLKFSEANIPVVVFKGIALSVALYGDVSTRDAGDVDLLVRRQDIVRAADLLVAGGHEPFFPTATARESTYLSELDDRDRASYLRSHCEHHFVHPKSRLNVDVHWAFALREFAVSLETGRLWSRAVAQSLCGVELRTLSPADMLLVLCLNGAKDRWERLDRVCDISALIRQLPEGAWTHLLSEAREAGMARMVAVGVLLSEMMLDQPAPDAAMALLRRDHKAVAIAGDIRCQLLNGQPRISSNAVYFDLSMRERVRDRIRYVLAHLRPGVGDWAAVPLPTALSSLHYLIRPFRLLARYGLARSSSPR